jgi:superfamily II DNA helicase RecQ
VLVAVPLSRPASSPRRQGRRRQAAPGAPAPAGAPLGPLVEALRAWRLEESRRTGVAPFVVLHDRTLLTIASVLPRTPDELLAIPGIGPAKLATYGEAVLNVVSLESSRSTSRP